MRITITITIDCDQGRIELPSGIPPEKTEPSKRPLPFAFPDDDPDEGDPA